MLLVIFPWCKDFSIKQETQSTYALVKEGWQSGQPHFEVGVSFISRVICVQWSQIRGISGFKPMFEKSVQIHYGKDTHKTYES